ncbi:MAG: hypothetical protein AAGB16_06990 [Pseudomonadota bacterium]
MKWFIKDPFNIPMVLGVISLIFAWALNAGHIQLPSPNNSYSFQAEFEAELERMAQEGDPASLLFLALQEHKPRFYRAFMQEFDTSLRQAMRRPDASQTFLEQAAYDFMKHNGYRLFDVVFDHPFKLSDSHMNRLLDWQIKRLEEIQPESSKLCVAFAHDEMRKVQNSVSVSPELQAQMFRLMREVLEAAPPATVKAANQHELAAWVDHVASPRYAILDVYDAETASDYDTLKACQASIHLLKRLQTEPAPERAKLYRGVYFQDMLAHYQG